MNKQGPSPVRPLSLVGLSGSYWDMLKQATRLIWDGRLDDAASLLERLIERIQRVPEQRRRAGTDLGELFISALWSLAQVQARRGEWGITQALFDQIQALAPERSLEWRKDLLLARIGAGDVAYGVRELHALAVAHPDDRSLWTALGRMVLAYHMREYVDETAERLWELSKNATDERDRATLHGLRLILLIGLQVWDKAVQAWQQSPSVPSDITEALVQALLLEGRLDLAERVLSENRLSPTETAYYSGLVAYRRKNMAAARRLWQRAVMPPVSEDQPPTQATFIKIGLAYCWLGDPKAAIEILTNLETFPLPDPAVLRALGLATAMLGNVEQAAEHFRMALSFRERNVAPPEIARALTLWTLGELVRDQAIIDALRPYLVETKPQSPLTPPPL